ncbi:MAG: gluconate 2-dehydrogenase subunit 3 family protein [Bacteroidia bacterium]|nr:gluconate 2-dehydrogenase subunit 3 family protein [Bacteroidia bacterium]NNL80388.1 gluconate 2-dehydrogenase subunit 3 family protein [Flavobacteriaceae bacterium]
MKRREALKNIGLGTGFVVVTPGLISLLQSCTDDVETWTPAFLSVEEGQVLTRLVDTILPKSDIPSATEVNVPQFIDKFINEVSDDEEQAMIKEGFGNLLAIIKSDYNEKLVKVSDKDYKDLLDKHMRIKGEDDEERIANPDSMEPTTSEFLNQIKWMTINAYKTTEEIGENVLAYDPVPAAYYCGDLDELTGGKSWSL